MLAQGCGRRCWPWSSRKRAGTRSHHCGGRPPRPAGWLTGCGVKGTGSAPMWWPACCVRKASACRPTPRPSKAPSTRTAMASSATSTIRSKRIRMPGIRSSAWTPRRRSSSAPMPTVAGNGALRATLRRRSRHMTFPTPGWARPSRMGSTIWPPTAAGSASAPTTTPPHSPWSRCVAGGWPKAEAATQARHGCWSPPMRAAPTATAPVRGRPSAAFAAQSGLEITVCHFPPGTSKWNTVEHRLFSHITMNWRGRPLTSHEVVVNTIAATTTRTGLRVAAELDTASYPTGIKVSDDQLAQVPIIRHSWHGEWNYTVHPMPPEPAEDNDDVPETPRRSPSRHWLRDPALTGLTPTQWDELIEKLSVARHAQREAHLHTRRGGTRHAAAGTGRKAVLTLDDRAAITVLYQRFSPSQRTLAHLFGVTQQTIYNVIRQTRTLLS